MCIACQSEAAREAAAETARALAEAEPESRERSGPLAWLRSRFAR